MTNPADLIPTYSPKDPAYCMGMFFAQLADAQPVVVKMAALPGGVTGGTQVVTMNGRPIPFVTCALGDPAAALAARPKVATRS